MSRGELQVLFRGVYALEPALAPHALEHAAVLACGPSAVLSHRSAAHLYELLSYPAPPGPIDVTVVGGHARPHPGIRAHRTASLRPHELRERSGIRVTAPPRTLIDLAAVCHRDELERAVGEAFALRLTNRSQLLRVAEAAGRRRGAARLRHLLVGAGPALTRSHPERVLLRAIRAAGLPEPETNARVGGWEVDFLWRDARLVVEVDGYSTHSSPRAFERDRRKDAEVAELGLVVQRFTADRVRDETDYVVGWVAARLVAVRG